MSVNLAGEGLLREVRRKEVEGGVGGVARVLLQRREGLVKRPPRNEGREESVDDGFGLSAGRDEGGWAVTNGRTKAGTSELDRKKGLFLRRFVEMTTDDEGESGELLVIEVLIGGEKVGSVAGPETVRELGEGVANF